MIRAIQYPLQRLVILLNFPPFTHAFAGLYRLGLNRALRALARHEAVRAVYGYGSFFRGDCLYGVSDIDLVIVIGSDYSRLDTVHHQIALTYTRLRRLFPFLQSWHEHAENLLFMSEVEAGFPVPEGVRLRAAQGRLVRLYGDPVPALESSEPITISEGVAEVASLLRIALMKGEVHASNLLFWKRLFTKLAEMADALELPEVAERIRSRPELDFVQQGDVRLFISKSDPDGLFALLSDFAGRIFDAVSAREQWREVRPERLGAAPEKASVDPAFAAAVKSLGGVLRWIEPPHLGLTPRMEYVPLDRLLPAVDLEDGGYRTHRDLSKALRRHGHGVESLLVRAGTQLCLYRRMPSFVDVIPLDPIRFANVHACLDGDGTSFRMLDPAYREQTEVADRTFAALADVYERNTGWIQKLPFPCIYLEEDRLVVEDALRRMRMYVLHTDGVDVRSVGALTDYLSGRHPSCRELLTELEEYHSTLVAGRGEIPRANNLYRSMLQFVSQLLSGRKEIAVEPANARLGITVGIITRNRAPDLEDALSSLTRQRRAPDEVLVVDNGSTDDTADVVDRYTDRLPVTYRFLAEASIPGARNLVLDEARHDVISFTDDDCVMEPGWLEAVERGFLRADNVGMVGGWVWHEPSPEGGMLDTYYSIFHHNKT